MMDRISIATWIVSFNRGEFDSADCKTQIKSGWYDWFCKDSSLVKKTQKMGNIIKGIEVGGKVDLTNWYVWFKNNCPLNGPLYDDFRFADLITGDIQMTIQIDCCWNNYRYTVYGRTSDGQTHWDEPLFECNTTKELIKWFNSPWEK